MYESHCPRDPPRPPGVSPWDAESACAYPDYPDDQIAAVTRLARDILGRHPEIDAARVVGHADIQPGNKTDPGPRFPWRQLASAGIGAWYDDADVTYYAAHFSAHAPSLVLVQEALDAYGYGAEPSGVLDRRTRDVLFAFQSHFLPQQRSGSPDTPTLAVLFALLERYRSGELARVRERHPELPPPRAAAREH